MWVREVCMDIDTVPGFGLAWAKLVDNGYCCIGYRLMILLLIIIIIK